MCKIKEVSTFPFDISLNLSWLVLEQDLLKLFINVWNNLSYISKYILPGYYCVGIWKKIIGEF